MSDDDQYGTRRVMDRLGETRRIPFFNVTEGDLGVLIGFPIAGLFVAAFTGQQWLTLPLVAIGLVIGVAGVYAAPAQLNAWTWLTDVARYALLRPRFTYREPRANGSSVSEGFVSYTPFEPEEQTGDLTGVACAWPGEGVLERSDGSMETFVELHPSNMDFAMNADWASIQRSAREFANGNLDFPLTFHATTRTFPVEELVDSLEDRLTDDDVRANDMFRTLVIEYRNRRPSDLADTRQIRYYLGLEVSKFDVHRRYRQEPTPAERLSEFPILGILATPFITRERYSEEELRRRMFEELDGRRHTVQTRLVDAIPGWSATPLTTIELVQMTAEFWGGEPEESREFEQWADHIGTRQTKTVRES